MIDNSMPAFPSHGSMGEVAQQGMTLRDYFAVESMGPVHDFRPRSFAQWLKWFCGCDYRSPIANHEDVAREAYKRADAMLAERIK